MATVALHPQPVRSRGQRLGIRARLLAANSVVVILSIATTVVAAAVGPPMFRRIMDRAVVPGLNADHPYERAFRDATALSVGTALAVSALAAMAMSWYLSRRMHRSTTELSQAATAIANGRYDIRVSPPRLGKEFDQIALAFNTMAQRLGEVEYTRRQMLADLAHEIRTPVSVLEGYMEALEDGVQCLDQDTISMLRDQTRRLTRFSVDVNALSSAEQNTTSIDARWVSVEEVIAGALATFAASYAAKCVALDARVPAGLSPVWADPERLGQVLSNLLDNALRHTRRGDRVQVVAESTDHDITISVSDTGDGVPAEHVTRLFDRFYRVDGARDRQHGGAGIGLAIAKALVEAHNGHIVASSDGVGAGCTFTLMLPRQHATVCAARPTADFR
ncbi:HAMP domain-containing histidine kinase [Mycolicibacterium sp. CH28]|uniref:sensor histidine kinase n=1 Tax=Mycolicibacterium sp. CH28 TaxID=2512237 RepID=UPI001081EE69|nr:HAMP domain-containing sensor histidine kinase [Mycolicibacterium sp. CH28]TGD85492.1 HAMP domain-containing histidine kinase [Mycolicibacterium sp. CH28]